MTRNKEKSPGTEPGEATVRVVVWCSDHQVSPWHALHRAVQDEQSLLFVFITLWMMTCPTHCLEISGAWPSYHTGYVLIHSSQIIISAQVFLFEIWPARLSALHHFLRIFFLKLQRVTFKTNHNYREQMSPLLLWNHQFVCFSFSLSLRDSHSRFPSLQCGVICRVHGLTPTFPSFTLLNCISVRRL